MKKSIVILLLFISNISLVQNSISESIKFDGVYETECYLEDDDDEGNQDYLRFYPNAKVISVGTDCDGNASDLKEWFNLNNKTVSSGNYKIDRNKISFETNSGTGTVLYWGRIKKGGILKLRWKSLINGNKGKAEYRFVKITNLR